MRIIFIPQYPTPTRYQEIWFSEFPKEFEKAGFEVITLGKDYVNMMIHRRGGLDMFAPVNMSIEFETQQIREYMLLDLKDDDIIFLADISFPGFFGNVFAHKSTKNMYAFCHATSINKFDYFEKEKYFKSQIEVLHSLKFQTIFIGSYYHKRKLPWCNTKVTYLPYPSHYTKLNGKPFSERKNNIISVSRPSPQKVTEEIENQVEKKFGLIKRQVSNTWDEYEDFLNNSKILLSTANEETFGYQIVDAIMHGCIPIAKNEFSYPELLSNQYLYDDIYELIEILEKGLSGVLPVPDLKCSNEMNNFYNSIITEIKRTYNKYME